MYKKILIPLENSTTDKVILNHIQDLARLCQAKLLFVHVADGFMARNQDSLNLVESEEMRVDREYLEGQVAAFKAEGFEAAFMLLCGEPSEKILQVVESEKCDLIAMATHGHRFLGDLVLGSVAEKIRHRTAVPILMVRAPLDNKKTA